MRTVLLFSLLTATWLPTPMVPFQDSGGSSRPVKKGDAITLKGCLGGSAIDVTEADDLDSLGLLATGLTFRLQGSKDVLKALREQHDGKVVTLKGVLKSDLPQQEGQSKNVGRMRITIGGPTPNPNSPHADSRRPLPVIEVKSFEGSGTTACR